MRVALLNLRYSPNLGDVLLCECLEFGLRKAMTGLDVLQLDITGRRDFAPGSSRRLAAMKLLQRLPLSIRQNIARVILGRSLRRTLPYWQMALAAADAAVLGGGNLLADADLNFPLKVSAMLNAVADAGLPAAVHAVGVSDNWSRSGQNLFRNALSGVRLVHAAVRDQESKAIWIRRLCPSGIAEPHIVRDPGLLTAECYPALARPTTSITRVGICITHPVALRYHADRPMPSAATTTAWFIELVQALTRKGFATFLFTTGSPEDEAYLDRVEPAFLAAAGGPGTVKRVSRVKTAADLAGFISTLDLVMAHRLHACIAAYSYEIPNIGFTWDPKMQSFFDSVGRSRYLCAAVSISASDAVGLAEEALHNGIDAEECRLVIAETQADIAGLLRNLAAA